VDENCSTVYEVILPRISIEGGEQGMHPDAQSQNNSYYH